MISFFRLPHRIRQWLLLACGFVVGGTLVAVGIVLWPESNTPPRDWIAERAILEWFQKPAAVRIKGQHDQTYVSWLSRNGGVMVRSKNHQTNTWGEPVEVVNLEQRYGPSGHDDHNAPTLLALPDHRLLLFSSVHDFSNALTVYTTTNPEDITSWSEPRSVIRGVVGEFDYPQPKLLPNGDIVLFLRHGTWKNATEIMTISSDQGQTWSAPRVVIDNGPSVGTYAFVTSHGMKLAIAWNTRRDAGRPSGLYYAQSLDGGVHWTTTSGKNLDVPFSAATAEKILGADSSVFAWDIIFDQQQSPRIAMMRENSPAKYSVALLQQGRWKVEDIVPTRELYSGVTNTDYYASGIVFDQSEPNEVVLGADHERLTLERWRRTSVGAWIRVSVIDDKNTEHQFRPQFVANDPSRSLIWVEGKYTGSDTSEWEGYERVYLRYQTP